VSGTAPYPPVTLTQFQGDYPEFSNATLYSASMISGYLAEANAALNPNRWQNFWVRGVELYVAHHLTLRGRQVKVALAGGVPGEATGITASKSVGGVSKSYDTASASEPDAGYWNGTIYGIEFWNLLQVVGMGGQQVSGAIPPGPLGWPLGVQPGVYPQ